MGIRRKFPSQNEVREALDYDPATGFMLWRERQNVPVQWNARWAGKPAGRVLKKAGKRSSDYIQIGLADCRYYGHQLAWIWMHGSIPDGYWPDHRNHDGTDNSAANLRLATKGQNNGNTRLYRNNTSGMKGVSFHRGTGRWGAAISVNGKQRHLGLFETREKARVEYVRAAEQHFGEFANP